MIAKTILIVTACGLLASTCNAHMVITSPVPYGQSSLNNSPLANDGSDFPCKQRPGVYDVTSMNQMTVGATQSLAFMGGATHGGGSCQLSVTLDKEPTQQSEWKVIHSIVGGCPSNVTGNLSDDADGTNASVFEYSIPKAVPNGQSTLAWTWFNKIGNREMYMNCAPITVTGGADNTDAFDQLPDMFVINIPNQECATVEGEDFAFPQPGDSAQTPFSTAIGSSTTGPGCASVTMKGAGAGKDDAAAAATAAPTSVTGTDASVPASSTSVGTSQQPAAGANNAPVTVTTLATVTSGTTPPSITSTSAAAALQTGTLAAPAGNASSNAADSPSSGSCTGGAVACSTPGDIVCIGSTQFGLCDINNCAVPQALADGTTCSNGAVTRKRSIRRFGRQSGERRAV